MEHLVVNVLGVDPEIGELTNSNLTHAGMFNIAYSDGHAKNMRWHVGATKVIGGGVIVAPRNTADQGKWCIDPTAVISSPLGDMPCGKLVPMIVASGVKWSDD